MQAQALVDGMVSIVGPGCSCDLSASVSLSEVETIMAEASAEALVEVCTGASPHGNQPDNVSALLLEHCPPAVATRHVCIRCVHACVVPVIHVD